MRFCHFFLSMPFEIRPIEFDQELCFVMWKLTCWKILLQTSNIQIDVLHINDAKLVFGVKRKKASRESCQSFYKWVNKIFLACESSQNKTFSLAFTL